MEMKDSISRLKIILNNIPGQAEEWNSESFSLKKEQGKWSKKEILGHLVDSAIANLDRFNKVQFSKKTLEIKPYPQDDLVKSNNYQKKELAMIVQLFLSLNHQILFIFENRLIDMKNKKVSISGKVHDLEFLCSDYIDHMVHHLKQLE